MRVESSKVFGLLAHELRSPLGVIQGYVRMLRMRRTDEDPETRMLTAMLDATGRIAAVARHASELALWENGAPAGDPQPVPLRSILERALAPDQITRPVAADPGEGGAGVVVRTSHPAALSAAITALVIAAGRHAPDAVLGLVVRTAPGVAPIVAIGPQEVLASLPVEAMQSADRARAADRLFGGGGQGLALVLASCVLDRHQIGVGLIESASDVIVLQLPKD